MEKKKCAILGARSTQRFFRSKDKRPPGFSQESSSSRGEGRNSCFLLRKHWEPKGRQFTHQVVALTQVLPPDLLLRCGVLWLLEETSWGTWAKSVGAVHLDGETMSWQSRGTQEPHESFTVGTEQPLGNANPVFSSGKTHEEGNHTRTLITTGSRAGFSTLKSAKTRCGFSSSPIQTHRAEVHGWGTRLLSYTTIPHFFRFNFTLLGEFGPISLRLSSVFLLPKKNQSISAQHLWIILHLIKASRWLTASEEPAVRQGCSFKSWSSKG